MMTYDAIVIGGSFAGLSAAIQLVRARRRVLVVDSGTPRNRFSPASHGFLGQDGRAPADILADARRQVLAYPTAAFRAGEVVDGRSDGAGFVLTLDSGEQIASRRIVIASGITDTLPDITGLAERWGRTVLHCPYCHGFEVADRPLGVLSAGARSVHLGAMLPDWGPTTYFTQGEHEPDPAEAAMLDSRGVTVERSSIVELLGAGSTLEAVRLADGSTVPLAALFVAPLTRPTGDLAERLGCVLTGEPGLRVIEVDGMQQTSVPGVFAAGDVARAMSNATLSSAAGVMAGVATHRSLVFDP